MASQEFAVEGLRCEGCVGTVTDALSTLPAVASVHIELAPQGTSTVRVSAEPEVSAAEVQAALKRHGDFTVVG